MIFDEPTMSISADPRSAGLERCAAAFRHTSDLTKPCGTSKASTHCFSKDGALSALGTNMLLSFDLARLVPAPLPAETANPVHSEQMTLGDKESRSGRVLASPWPV